MKRICILTATRAEYGLLKSIIIKLLNRKEIEVKVVVTGAHLAPEYGLTYLEIEKDGIQIDKKIPILLSSDTSASISKTMGLALITFADYFEESKPDMLLVLGDRYETLAVCIAAMNQHIPITHLYGGEKTEGAMDEAIRHAITKISYLHFTSTEEYRKRVIQLGESPSRVYNVGAMGVENAVTEQLLSKKELEESIGFNLGTQYAMVTFHPVTMEKGEETKQVQELLKALNSISQLKYIITKANADIGGKTINQLLEQFAKTHSEQVILVDSLGVKRYLSALKNCRMVIGNSSSGLVEAPSFYVPTINIGNRQKGRMLAESVITCQPIQREIEAAMNQSMSKKMQIIARRAINPYGDGKSSDKIVTILCKNLVQGNIEMKKQFYDIEFVC